MILFESIEAFGMASCILVGFILLLVMLFVLIETIIDFSKIEKEMEYEE